VSCVAKELTSRNKAKSTKCFVTYVPFCGR
jgi:hypothetical protein